MKPGKYSKIMAYILTASLLAGTAPEAVMAEEWFSDGEAWESQIAENADFSEGEANLAQEPAQPEAPQETLEPENPEEFQEPAQPEEVTQPENPIQPEVPALPEESENPSVPEDNVIGKDEESLPQGFGGEGGNGAEAGFENPDAQYGDEQTFEEGFFSISEDETDSETFFAGTDEGTYGSNLRWSVSNQVLTISGSGEMKDSENGKYPWTPYADSITRIVLEEGVASVASGAFFNFIYVESISLPSTMRILSPGSFANCVSLTQVSLNQGLTEVSDYAFQSCPLTEITLPASLTTLSRLAFWECRSLAAANVAAGSQTYVSVNGVMYTKDMGTLWYCPINNCPGKTYTIPSSVHTVGAYSFCSGNLTGIQIPSSVKKLEEGCFHKSAIQSLVIPDTVTEIENFICQDCESLISLDTGNGIKALSYKTFSGCSNLKNVRLGNNLEDLYYLAFADCSSLEAIVIPNKVTVIPNGSFGNCYALKSVVFPAGLKEIWYQGFLNCESLTSVTFPEGFTSVMSLAFWGTGIKEVTFPSTVEMVGEQAFPDGTKLNFKKPLESEGGAYMKVEKAPIKVEYDYTSAFEVLRLVNQERAAEGLSALKMDRELLDAAMLRAAETSVFFDHERPTGLTCFSASKKMVSENIAVGQGTAVAAMESWMTSQDGHRENILTESHREIGVGAVKVNGVRYWVQVFGGEAAEVANSSSYKNYTSLTEVKFVLPKEGESYKFELAVWPEAFVMRVEETAKVELGFDNTFCFTGIESQYVDFSSSNPAVCKAAAGGTITAVSPGTAEIKAVFKSNPKLSKTMKVTVEKVDLSFSGIIDSIPTQHYTGKAITPLPHVSYGDITLVKDRDYTVSYKNNVQEGFATVEVTGKGDYTGTRTRRFYITKWGHEWSAWKVTRKPTETVPGIETRTCGICEKTETRQIPVLLGSVKLNQSKLLVSVNQKFYMKVTGLKNGVKVSSWSSSNPKTVYVSAKGTIIGKKKGSATITVTLSNKQVLKAKVTVQNGKVKTAKLSGIAKSTKLGKGKKYSLKPVLSPVTSQEKVTYSSSKTKVATVTSKGVITAKAAGTAYITVRSGSKKAVIKVVVPKTATIGIKHVPKAKTLKRGRSYTIKASPYPSNSDEKITFKSSNSKVAVVTSKGKVTAKKKGTAYITVKSGKKSVKCKITVK